MVNLACKGLRLGWSNAFDIVRCSNVNHNRSCQGIYGNIIFDSIFYRKNKTLFQF